MNLNMLLAKPIKTVKLTVLVRALLGLFFCEEWQVLSRKAAHDVQTADQECM